MFRSPRWTAAAACALLVVLTVTAPRPAVVHPSDAAAHEGSDVRVQGVVVDVRTWPDGRSRTVIAQDGDGLVVSHDGPPPQRGAWVEAGGTMRRFGGELRLDADRLDVVAAPAGMELPLSVIAADPTAHIGRLISVRGEVQGAVLRDGAARVATGDGPWTAGVVVAQGVLGYDATCLCYRFHAAAIRPWT